MVFYVDIIGLCHSVAKLWEIYVAYMSCEVAALPFQVLANYGTWSIDFALIDICIHKLSLIKARIKIYYIYSDQSRPNGYGFT